jgi:hypothetical protein
MQGNADICADLCVFGILHGRQIMPDTTGLPRTEERVPELRDTDHILVQERTAK